MQHATLLIKKKGKLKRILHFESHLDAFDIAQHYRNAGFDWEMLATEFIPKGEKPDGMPLKQLSLLEMD